MSDIKNNKKETHKEVKSSNPSNQTNFSPSQVVCFGEPLWDMIPVEKQVKKAAGGAPLNVAYHLQRLGNNPAVISRVGYDELGKELVQSFEKKGVCTDYFQIDYLLPTSTVEVTIDNNQDIRYQIVNQVAWDNIQLSDDLLELVKNTDYFIYGSLAARNKTTRATLSQLLPLAKTNVMDMNLRAPFYSRDTITDMLKLTDILKLNLSELELVTGWYTNFTSIEDRIKILSEKFALQMVIVTLGKSGAVVYSAGYFNYAEGLTLEVADTIGSGDAFLAGMISAVIAKHPVKEALNFANRLAGLISTKVGGCPDYQLDELKELDKEVVR